MQRYKLKKVQFSDGLTAWLVFDKKSDKPEKIGNQAGDLNKNPHGSGFMLELHGNRKLINGKDNAPLQEIRQYLKTLT